MIRARGVTVTAWEESFSLALWLESQYVSKWEVPYVPECLNSQCPVPFSRSWRAVVQCDGENGDMEVLDRAEFRFAVKK